MLTYHPIGADGHVYDGILLACEGTIVECDGRRVAGKRIATILVVVLEDEDFVVVSGVVAKRLDSVDM